MPADPTEPLWKEVLIGDPEPWRRGRLLLVSVAVLLLLSQALVLLPPLLAGAVETLLSLAIAMAISWLLFVLVWFGVGWLRWVLGIYSMLFAMALLIWAYRDSTPLRLIGVAVHGYVGWALLTPAVYHFAVRQRERLRWPEKLAVIAALVLVIGSFFTGLIGFQLHAAAVQRDAQAYGARAMQRMFVEKDTRFLLDAASEQLLQNYGRSALSQLMVQRYMTMGEVQQLQTTGSSISTHIELPLSVVYRAKVQGLARGDWGAFRVQVELIGSEAEWKINGVQWRYSY